jgi:hypothetical protein
VIVWSSTYFLKNIARRGNLLPIMVHGTWS